MFEDTEQNDLLLLRRWITELTDECNDVELLALIYELLQHQE